MVAEGLEDTGNLPEKYGPSESGGAESGAFCSACHSDPMLAQLIDLWPTLPLEVREKILQTAVGE